jgi:hypothetical protein
MMLESQSGVTLTFSSRLHGYLPGISEMTQLMGFWNLMRNWKALHVLLDQHTTTT